MQDDETDGDPLINIEIEHCHENADPDPGGGSARPAILVADDDVPTCIFLKRVLGNFGCDLLEAHNGNVALELYNENASRISLVVLDVIMPGMDGERVLDAIREQSRDVRVLMISSELSPDVRQGLLEHGATDLLAKPLDTVTLTAAARRLLPTELAATA